MKSVPECGEAISTIPAGLLGTLSVRDNVGLVYPDAYDAGSRQRYSPNSSPG